MVLKEFTSKKKARFKQQYKNGNAQEKNKLTSGLGSTGLFCEHRYTGLHGQELDVALSELQQKQNKVLSIPTLNTNIVYPLL